jgi:hypothetical protein
LSVALAAAILMTTGAHMVSAGQENTAKIQANNLPAGVSARGMAAVTRTSDSGAAYVDCIIQGSATSCTASNDNSFPPKNIGNVACIPINFNKPVVTQQCSALLSSGSGNCQTNSAAGVCNPKLEWEFKPVCNYRTESSSDTSANWTWQLNASSVSNGAFSLDCSYTGFQGYSQN